MQTRHPGSFDRDVCRVSLGHLFACGTTHSNIFSLPPRILAAGPCGCWSRTLRDTLPGCTPCTILGAPAFLPLFRMPCSLGCVFVAVRTFWSRLLEASLCPRDMLQSRCRLLLPNSRLVLGIPARPRNWTPRWLPSASAATTEILALVSRCGSFVDWFVAPGYLFYFLSNLFQFLLKIGFPRFLFFRSLADL